MQAEKALMSLCGHTVSPEFLLLASDNDDDDTKNMGIGEGSEKNETCSPIGMLHNVNDI